jgi:hypothetical protein
MTMATLTAWDGTVFEIDPANESAAYQSVAEYTQANPPPVVDPPTPTEPTPTRDSVLELGYLDDPTGIKLKANINAQTRFTSLKVGQDLAIEEGFAQPTDEVVFTDFSDVPHSIPYPALKSLLLRYMGYCQYIESQYP